MNQDNELNNQTFGENTTNQTYVTYIPYGFTPETFEERKKIKKTALTIGGTLLIMSAVSFFLSVALGLVLSFLGISGINVYSILNDPAVNKVFQILVSSFIFTVPFIVIFKCAGFNISELVPVRRPKKSKILPLFLFGVSFCAFANIAVSFLGNIFSSMGINYEVDFGENPQGLFGFLLSLIATAIVPPLVEEFACRGLILGSLRKFGNGFAIITSSILFGIMHGNFQQMPFAFLVGLVLAYITVKSNTLWIAIAVHAFNNFISVFFSYALNDVSTTMQNAYYTIFLTVCLLAGIVAVYLLKNDDKAYTFSTKKTKCTEAQKYKWFFGGVTIIIFIVVSFLEALTYFK